MTANAKMPIARLRFGGAPDATWRIMAIINTMIAICDGSRYRYGISPEYQSFIGGSHRGCISTTTICPVKRATNNASRISRSATLIHH